AATPRGLPGTERCASGDGHAAHPGAHAPGARSGPRTAALARRATPGGPARGTRGHELQAGRRRARHPDRHRDVPAASGPRGPAPPDVRGCRIERFRGRVRSRQQSAYRAMTTRQISIDEDDFQAFVDGQLPPDRRRAVMAYLAARPEESARMSDYRRLTEELHLLYDEVLYEPRSEERRVGEDTISVQIAARVKRIR